MALILASGSKASTDWFIGKAFKASIQNSGTHIGSESTSFLPCAGLSSIIGTLTLTLSTGGSGGATFSFYDDSDTQVGTDITENTNGSKTISVPNGAAYVKMVLLVCAHATSGTGNITFTPTSVT